ncbi:MAG: hypothetical protein KJO39_11620 [Bacteroidia bacterium]|nr:hypothetical protein [Bacteroidia bacterium]NNF31730.1 hypothetical protein [Flavobacteriaceae bacterium]NNJ81109.1 hypothetical protein [Flavobacteriaceae bacterium]NNK55244.1 hypothetical protein [Flavobacteriaceae bacterium]NNM10239.1 hypothetical protein [Flavobacteriaceae bacterium]
MKRLSITVISAFLLFLSCKSKDGLLMESECGKCEDAVIRNYGDPALDGCGWVVDVSSTIYKPENLPEQYKIDSLDVMIGYKVLDSVNCGLIRNAHPGISITEIKKKN